MQGRLPSAATPITRHCCYPAAASAKLSYGGLVILAVLLVLLWSAFLLVTAALRSSQRRQLAQQEGQDRLWRVLQPLMLRATGASVGAEGTAAGRCVSPLPSEHPCSPVPPTLPSPSESCPSGADCPAQPYLSDCRWQPGLKAFRGVRPRLTLQFEGLGLRLHDGRSILAGVTGRWGILGGIIP